MYFYLHRERDTYTRVHSIQHFQKHLCYYNLPGSLQGLPRYKGVYSGTIYGLQTVVGLRNLSGGASTSVENDLPLFVKSRVQLLFWVVDRGSQPEAATKPKKEPN